MTRVKRATTVLLIILVLTLILASPVSAGLRVTNPKIQETVSSGELKTYIMNVGNTTDEPMDIIVEVRGLGNHITGPIEALLAENDLSPYTARLFTTASPTSFHLEPGQSRDVTVTISVPADVGDGGRYADIFIHTTPSGGGQIVISLAVSAQVLLSIENSNLTITGDITSIDVPQAVSEQLLSATTTIQNTGNYHYKLTCNGTVRNSLGQVVGTAWQANSIYNLIPTFSQQIDVGLNISETLSPDTYTVEIAAYTQDGVFLDSGTKTFVLTDMYEPMLLTPLLIEFRESGQLTMYQWDMSEDGTLMEDADATSLSSSINILIRQGTNVLWAEGQSASNIAVEPIDPSPPSEYAVINAYDFSPEGVSFDPSIYITLGYLPADIPEGVSEAQLSVATFDEDTLQWVYIEDDDVEIDTDANTITFPVDHFSVYAILAPEEGGSSSAGAASRLWIWMVIGAVWVVIIVFTINTLQHRRAVAVRKEQSRRRPRRPQGPRNDEW